MDPEERDELLREVDEELDDTEKGRAIKETIRMLAASSRQREPDDAADES